MPEHPRNSRILPKGRWNINRFALAYGEADVQPSLLPEHFSTGFLSCQELFVKCRMMNAKCKKVVNASPIRGGGRAQARSEGCTPEVSCADSSPQGQCHQLKRNQILFKFCENLEDLCFFTLVSERLGRTGTTAFIKRFLISRNSRSRFMIDGVANISMTVLFNSDMVMVMFIW